MMTYRSLSCGLAHIMSSLFPFRRVKRWVPATARGEACYTAAAYTAGVDYHMQITYAKLRNLNTNPET